MLLTCGAALLFVASAAVSFAHEDAVLDLGPVETLCAQRIGETTGRDRKAYRTLQRALRAPTREKLTSDLVKLKAVLSCLTRVQAGDPAIESLLPGLADAADAALAAVPEVVEQKIDQVAKARDRSRVETLALAAYDLHQTAKELRTLDVAGCIRGFAAASKKYDQALAAARAAVRRQRGPLPQFKTAKAGHVYSVAGTGAGGFNGEGRPARRSSLYFVADVRFGPDGMLYILDWNNHCVRRLRQDGTLERVCGSGVPGDTEGDPATTAFNHPSSLAFDPQGRIYFAAWHNHKVKVFDPTLPGGPRVVTIAGTVQGKGGDGGLATQAKFNLLPGIARYPNGDLLVTDAGNQVIRRIRLSTPTTDTNVAGVTVTTGPIELFAGTQNVEGYAGDDGPRLSSVFTFSRAQNAEPDGRMELDAQGNVFVTCSKGAVVRKIAADGTVTTLAGTGVAGYSGDDGPAKQAQLNQPSDIALAPDGTVYISDSGNNVIRRVAPDGKITTIAGASQSGYAGDGDVAVNARFSRPDGLELDAHGNLWVCDRYNSRVRVIAGVDASSAAANPAPLLVPIDPYELPLPSKGAPPTDGDAGTIATLVGTPGTFGFNGDGRLALDTQLYWPQDVTVDPQFGQLHLLDWNNHRVRRVEADGTVTTIIGSGELGDTTGPAREVRLNHPTDLAFHPQTGELWVAGWHTDKILRLAGGENIVYMAGKTRAFSGDDGPPNLAEMNLPSSVKFDAAGNWYVGDEGNRRIRFVNAAENKITTICGDGTPGTLGDNGDGGPAADATLNFPVGQAAQPGGRVCLSPGDRYLYIADTNNHSIRRIDLQDPERTIVTVAGSGTPGYSGDDGPATEATLRNPTDVDCDADGNIYIADGDNSAIRRVDILTGNITTIAGQGTPGFTGDGGPAADAKLNYPSGLFVNRTNGRIYVADTYNGVIRVIWE